MLFTLNIIHTFFVVFLLLTLIMYLFAGLMVLDENIKSKFRKSLPAKIVWSVKIWLNLDSKIVSV